MTLETCLNMMFSTVKMMLMTTRTIDEFSHLPLVYDDKLVSVFLKEYKVNDEVKRKLVLFFKPNNLVVENKSHVGVERVEEILKKQTWREVHRSVKGLYTIDGTKRTVSQIYKLLKSKENEKKAIERLKPLFDGVTTIRENYKRDDYIIIRGCEIEEYGLIYDENGVCAFSRKSQEKQSKAKVEDALSGVVAEAVFLAPDSSGYFEESILDAVSYCYNEGLKLKVFSLTRSVIETATRNLVVATELVNVSRLYDIETDINGDIRNQYGEIFLLLVGLMAETRGVQNANTQYSAKHKKYKEALINKDFSKLNERELKDLLALVRYNGSHSKTIAFIDALKRKKERNKAKQS